MNTFKFPASPGTPLFPLSPERVNSTSNHSTSGRCSPFAAAAITSPQLTSDGNIHRNETAAASTPSALVPASATSAFSPPTTTSRSRHEFGKSTPLVAYTTSGTARPITAALAASMTATPTIAPFQLDISKSPPRSPFRANNNDNGSGAAARYQHHSRNNSDAMVQGMIARFDGLSVRDWRSQGETAVRRAEMAREMAEMESEKLRKQIKAEEEDRLKSREEARRVKKEVEESRERERKMARRIEVLMDELSRAKDTHGHTVAVYEKEVRKTRKEGLKSASNLIKVQEEFKATRAQLRASQTNLETERLKAAKHEQEAFTSQYQLVGVQAELQRALENCKVMEQERDALKTSLKEEELLRVAAEGRIALPTTKDEDEEDLLLLSPMKSPAKPLRKMQRQQQVSESESEKENTQPAMRQSLMQLKDLQEELALERRMRQKAVNQVDFMKMECQFQSCSCRLAEQRGKSYVHDSSFAQEMEVIKSHRPASPVRTIVDDAMEVDFPVDAVAVLENDGQQPREIAVDEKSSIEQRERILATQNDEEEADIVPLPVKTKPERRVSAMSARRSARRESLRLASLEQSESATATKSEDSNLILIEEEIAMEIMPVVAPEAAPDALSDEQEAEVIQPTDLVIESLDEQREELDTTPAPESPTMSIIEPQTPADVAVRTITTTTTIPMQFSPVKQQLMSTADQTSSLPSTPRTIAHPPYYHHQHAGMNDENIPPPTPNGVFKADGTIDREAALEMIRQRRSRATSLKVGEATPKRQMVQGGARRDVSAPHAGKNGMRS